MAAPGSAVPAEETQLAYPEQLLASDEKVVRHLHPHWITLVPPVLVFVVVATLTGFGIALVPTTGSRQPLLVAILVLAVVLLVPFALVPVLRWGTTHYVITTHRVMLRTGVLNRQGKDVAYPRITDVAYEQSLWDRIVSSGTLTIESAGEGPPQVLDNLPRSDEVQQLINRLVQEDDTRRAREAGRFYGQGPAGPPPGAEPDLGREPTARFQPPTDDRR